MNNSGAEDDLAYLWPPSTTLARETDKTALVQKFKSREVVERLNLKDERVKQLLIRLRSGWRLSNRHP